jgi:hypothetical protein
MNLLRLALLVLCVARDLAVDALGFARSSFHSRTALIAENLFLRKQLGFYQEHQVRPRRLTDAARLALVFWSRLFAWRFALVVVKPATLIGWHRKAFRLFWKRKSKPGRRPIPLRLRQLIEQMVGENPIWGEERIANELWLKLGIRCCPQKLRTKRNGRLFQVEPHDGCHPPRHYSCLLIGSMSLLRLIRPLFGIRRFT